MDGKKRIERLRKNEFAWAKDVLNAFKVRDGPKVKKVCNPKPVVVHPKLAKPVEPKGRFASAHAFEQALEKRGFKKLGSGAYSSVYGKDGHDRVIKVTRYLDNWIDYVAWASKNGYAGTFAPRVYSWKRFKYAKKEVESWNWRGNTDWSVAVVERMKETLNADSQLAKDFKIIERIHDLSVRSVLAELVMDEIVPGVGSFFKKLHKAFHASDVYGKNLMIRQDGSFCVTDPVCGTIMTEANRFRAADFVPALIRYWRYIEGSSRY